MFDCHLKKQFKGCRKMYGKSKKNPCSLCSCRAMKLETCKAQNYWNNYWKNKKKVSKGKKTQTRTYKKNMKVMVDQYKK